MKSASFRSMRIELQLVAFERGEYAPIPVACAGMGTQLVNQLVISHFAIKTLRITAGKERAKRGQLSYDGDHRVSRNDSPIDLLPGNNAALSGQSHAIPIRFADPVRFEVPIH